MGLGAVQPALAIHATRAYRDHRLDNMITRAERVLLRIHKGQHPLTLVFIHKQP